MNLKYKITYRQIIQLSINIWWFIHLPTLFRHSQGFFLCYFLLFADFFLLLAIKNEKYEKFVCWCICGKCDCEVDKLFPFVILIDEKWWFFQLFDDLDPWYLIELYSVCNSDLFICFILSELINLFYKKLCFSFKLKIIPPGGLSFCILWWYCKFYDF